MSEAWKGYVTANEDVKGFIKENGAPVHSKPNGEGSMILYYVDPDASSEETQEEVHDYAGEDTPGTRTMIVNRAVEGGTQAGSTVVERKIGVGKVAVPNANPALYQNPNELAENATIEGEVSEEVEEAEQADEEGTERSDVSIQDSVIASDVSVTGEVETTSGESESLDISPDISPEREERTFAELDEMDKDKLQAMYDEEYPDEELKGTGSGGNVLKADLVNALRTDKA